MLDSDGEEENEWFYGDEDIADDGTITTNSLTELIVFSVVSLALINIFVYF